MKIVLIIMGILFGVSGLAVLVYGLSQWNAYVILGAVFQILVSVVLFWAFATVEELQRNVRVLKSRLFKMKEQKREGD